MWPYISARITPAMLVRGGHKTVSKRPTGNESNLPPQNICVSVNYQLMHEKAHRVASGRTHNVFAICCRAPATTASCPKQMSKGFSIEQIAYPELGEGPEEIKKKKFKGSSPGKKISKGLPQEILQKVFSRKK